MPTRTKGQPRGWEGQPHDLSRRGLLAPAVYYKDALLRALGCARHADPARPRSVPFFGAGDRSARDRFRDINVVGIGYGAKETAGRATGVTAVRVYVSRKTPRAELARRQRVPPTIEGCPTDVIRVGRFRLHARPAFVGTAASHLTGKAGALGCYVTRANEPGLHVLSASHVFAPTGAAIQDVIVEPPAGQVGVSPLATLVDFEPLVPNGVPNAFDAAIARLDLADDGALVIPEIGPQLDRASDAVLYQSVRKFGPSTFHTVGVVMDAAADAEFSFGGKSYAFENVIQVTGSGGPFSIGGDSGALVVDALTRRPLGLVIGGAGDRTFVSPLPPILTRFRARLAAGS